MEDYISKTIRAYDDTQTYEDSTRLLVPKIELDKFLGLVGPGSLLLDAGCAFGRDTEYIKSKGYEVEAIDLSPALIARARELQPGINFSVKDVRETGFANEQFDGIWCNATLLHLNDSDMDKALAEFCRVLKSGGILTVSLKKGSGSQQLVEKFSSNAERFFNFKTREAFLPQLVRSGFVEIESYYLNERERYGQDRRDLNWLYAFVRKK
jgi:SAM-dependent methyltransferase